MQVNTFNYFVEHSTFIEHLAGRIRPETRTTFSPFQIGVDIDCINNLMILKCLAWKVRRASFFHLAEQVVGGLTVCNYV